MGAAAGEHRATVIRRVHGVNLPPEVKRRTAHDREINGSADRPQPAYQRAPSMHLRAAGVARHHEIDNFAHRAGPEKPGHQHVGIGHVQLPVPGRLLTSDREAAAAVSVHEGREHCRRVEPRQAAPVDCPVRGYQGHDLRDGMRVTDDRVILDGRVTVRHDCSPRRWRSR
jgi:hypothetical protein